MAIQFANRLRDYALTGRLRAVWTHVPNELAGASRATVPAAIARAAGLISGTADYLFLWGGGSLALEAKSATGRQSPGQRDFADWCAAHGVPYHVFRTVEDGEAILTAAGVLQ